MALSLLNYLFLTLLVAHIFAAIYCPILDCDEVFNYWEPLHHLVHGEGLQTWEYSGSFALRSYLYLLIHSPVIISTKFLGFSKLYGFYALRIQIAFLTTICEIHWLNSLEMKLGPRIKIWTYFFLMFSSGMFISSAAFIPSSFSMSCLLLCQSYQLRKNIFNSIFFGGLAVILGWPFCVIILIPIGMGLIYDHGLFSCVKNGIISLFIIAIPTISCDSFFYLPSSSLSPNQQEISEENNGEGPIYDKNIKIPKIVWSTLNLVVYNMFPHGTGSELYGIESWHFYIRNLILNFNIVYIFAMISFIFLLIMLLINYRKISQMTNQKHSDNNEKLLILIKKQYQNCYLALFWLFPFFLWFTFLTLLPHKEERFMFVIYPQLCFSGACSFVILETSFLTPDLRTTRTLPPPFGSIGPSSVKLPYTSILRNRLLFISALLYLFISLIRSNALVNHYQAPFQVYSWLGHEIQTKHNLINTQELNKNHNHDDGDKTNQKKTRVCVGKEWYRFPSHFFFPQNTELMFIESEFKGELPRHFNAGYGTHGPWGGDLFNDINVLQSDIFVDKTTCDYVVDLQLNQEDDDEDDVDRKKQMKLEPWSQPPCDSENEQVCLISEQSRWTLVHEAKFLDAANTRFLPRIFYLPGSLLRGHEYIQYQVFENSRKE